MDIRQLVSLDFELADDQQAAQPASDLTPDQGEAKRRSWFFVNGEWRKDSMMGQMYVESLEPWVKRHPFPVVLIHGDFHTMLIWQRKPDGNQGWASFFLRQGYHVYLVDLPPSGRSNYLGNLDIKTLDPGTSFHGLTPKFVEDELTAPEKGLPTAAGKPLYPKARFHDKWPGTGQRGDAIFDNYYASLVKLQLNKFERQTLAQNGLRALLKKTGKAVLVGEGMGCTMAWLATDIEPGLVAAVVAVEPAGPPCGSALLRHPRAYSPWAQRDVHARIYGLADIPLTYDPPARADACADAGRPALNVARMTRRDGGGACWLQRSAGEELVVTDRCFQPLAREEQPGCVRRLLHLQKVPHAVVSAHASPHGLYDWATHAFLCQAGVRADHLRLEDAGLRGNGHLMFLETNSDAVAGVLEDWIRRAVGAAPSFALLAPVREPAVSEETRPQKEEPKQETTETKDVVKAKDKRKPSLTVRRSLGPGLVPRIELPPRDFGIDPSLLQLPQQSGTGDKRKSDTVPLRPVKYARSSYAESTARSQMGDVFGIEEEALPSLATGQI